jgi:hypothetical protein
MRYALLLPLLGLGLAGCVAPTPPTTTTTTYHPATTETVVSQPAGAYTAPTTTTYVTPDTYMAPGPTYLTPGTSSTTTVIRQ